jgi:2',3'-cyclic-nucleotide 2'-phosphodiesterase
MKVLFIGDIIGQPGRMLLRKTLDQFRRLNGIDFVIANGENSAGGNGITREVANEMISCGVNAITLGNHTWARKEIDQIIDEDYLIRPANYPPGTPGKGWNVYPVRANLKIAVVNLMGRVYMPLIDDPFRKADEILELIKPHTKNIVVDFHAEITSEKLALGWYLNGRVSALLGTHTHVQTSDARVLPDGTAYITDCGMCGPRDGIIGVDRNIVLKKYVTGLPYRFEVSKGDAIFNACILDIDENSGRARGIEAVSTIFEEKKLEE